MKIKISGSTIYRRTISKKYFSKPALKLSKIHLFFHRRPWSGTLKLLPPAFERIRSPSLRGLKLFAPSQSQSHAHSIFFLPGSTCPPMRPTPSSEQNYTRDQDRNRDEDKEESPRFGRHLHSWISTKNVSISRKIINTATNKWLQESIGKKCDCLHFRDRLPETKLTLTKLIIKQWSPKNGTHLALANTKVTLASPSHNKPIQSQRSKHWCCRPSAQSTPQISPAPPYRILPSPSSIQRRPGIPAHSYLRKALSWDRKGRRAQCQEKMWRCRKMRAKARGILEATMPIGPRTVIIVP